MDKNILLEKLKKFCPPWIKQPDPTLSIVEILQSVISQVLPGLLDVKIISIDEHKIVGSVDYQNKTANVVGYMHGGTIFSTGDTLGGAYLWYISNPDNYAVTAKSEIRYFKPFKNGTLLCTVTEKSRHGRKVTLEAIFTDSENQTISILDLDYLLMSLSKEGA